MSLTRQKAGNLTYKNDGTGAVVRTIKDKLGETVSVKDFGAVGDGTTDDLAAFEAARDYAMSNNRPAIFIPDGNYYISSTLVLSSIRMYGNNVGNKDLTGGAIISSDVASAHILELTGQSGITGIRFIATGATTNGIIVKDDSFYTRIDNVYIRQDTGSPATGTYGLTFEGGPIGVTTDGLYWTSVSNLHIERFDRGVYVTGDVTSVYFYAPIILGCQYGMDLEYSTSETNTINVYGGAIENCTSHGAYIEARQCSFFGTRFEASPIGVEQANTGGFTALHSCFFAANATNDVLNSSGNYLIRLDNVIKSEIPFLKTSRLQQDTASVYGFEPQIFKNITGSGVTDLVTVEGATFGTTLLYIQSYNPAAFGQQSSAFVRIPHAGGASALTPIITDQQSSHTNTDMTFTTVADAGRNATDLRIQFATSGTTITTYVTVLTSSYPVTEL